MPKKPTKPVSPKSLRKAANKVHAANERVRQPASKRQPKEDFNEATHRVFEEIIRRSESVAEK